MRLVVTIDTEEDNWGEYSPEGQTLKNIEKIPALQDLFDSYDVKPTYLITYPVATNEKSIRILSEIEKSGRCEIGMHCHPWNTPPHEEETNGMNSMLCNLPQDMQYRKLDILHNKIKKNFDVLPVSFRGGRWGYNRTVAENLIRLGYKVDTSVTPYVDWGKYHGPDFSDLSPQLFKVEHQNGNGTAPGNQLLEVPATIGFLQNNFEVVNMILKTISRKPINRLRIVGILDKLNMLNKVWLSPEVSQSRQMIRLTECLMRKDYELINMFFHSTTLQPGLNNFDGMNNDEKHFLKRIKEFLIFAKEHDIASIKLSETLNLPLSMHVPLIILPGSGNAIRSKCYDR